MKYIRDRPTTSDCTARTIERHTSTKWRWENTFRWAVKCCPLKCAMAVDSSVVHMHASRSKTRQPIKFRCDARITSNSFSMFAVLLVDINATRSGSILPRSPGASRVHEERGAGGLSIVGYENDGRRHVTTKAMVLSQNGYGELLWTTWFSCTECARWHPF